MKAMSTEEINKHMDSLHAWRLGICQDDAYCAGSDAFALSVLVLMDEYEKGRVITQSLKSELGAAKRTIGAIRDACKHDWCSDGDPGPGETMTFQCRHCGEVDSASEAITE